MCVIIFFQCSIQVKFASLLSAQSKLKTITTDFHFSMSSSPKKKKKNHIPMKQGSSVILKDQDLEVNSKFSSKSGLPGKNQNAKTHSPLS